MRFACVTDGHDVRVYNDFLSADTERAAIEYAEHCDGNDAEGPTERVVFVRDLDDPEAAVVAVSITYELSPTYYGGASNEEPDAEMREALAEVR